MNESTTTGIDPLPPTPPFPVPHVGWSCPRCGRVNAPFVPLCPCYLYPVRFAPSTYPGWQS